MSGLRDARAADVDAVAALQVRSWQQGYAGIMPTEQLDALDPAAWADRWRETFARPPRPGIHRVVALDDDDRVVGIANFGTAPEPDGIHTGQLWVYYTDPAVWGQGHGGRLLREVHRRLAADGHDGAMLWVAADNARTIAIYEHLGWRLDGTQQVEEMNGITITEARMLRPLP